MKAHPSKPDQGTIPSQYSSGSYRTWVYGRQGSEATNQVGMRRLTHQEGEL